MIQKEKTGKFRVRWDYGHNSYYKSLLRDRDSIASDLKKVTKDKRSQALKDKLEVTEREISRMERQYGNGKPVSIQTRRSFNCANEWQANLVEKMFKDAFGFEAKGQPIPSYLEKELNNLEEAPYRYDYLEEIAWRLAQAVDFNPHILDSNNYELFMKQTDVNKEWLEHFEITDEEIRKHAAAACCDEVSVPLVGKSFIYTGSFVSFMVCSEFVQCLHKMIDYYKLDGVISNGPWGKYIFKHKSSQNSRILAPVKKLASKTNIYALRSNKEAPEIIPSLKELGIKFVSKISDKNNVFLNHQCSNMSQKDQLRRFRDLHDDKNMFVCTSYVAFEPVLRNNNIRYIIGSGSSSYNTPTSRIWTSSFDSARLNSVKYDNIGGHVLRFDSKGNVFPTGFFYNKKEKAVFCNGMVFPANGDPYPGKLHLLLSDLHTETMDRVAFNCFLQFLEKHVAQVKSVCINGDFLDNVLINHHDEDKIKTQVNNRIEHKSFLHEIANARAILHAIVSRLGTHRKDVRLVFKFGNHEMNSIKKLLNKPLVHFLDSMLDLDALLGLSELGFEIIDDKKPYYVGEIPVFHGHEMSRPKASAVLGKSVSGHWHRAKIDNDGVLLPTMQDQSKVGYLRYHKTDWTTGWGVSIESRHGTVEKPEIVLVQEGKYFDFEKIAHSKSALKVEAPKHLSVKFTLK